MTENVQMNEYIFQWKCHHAFKWLNCSKQTEARDVATYFLNFASVIVTYDVAIYFLNFAIVIVTYDVATYFFNFAIGIISLQWPNLHS